MPILHRDLAGWIPMSLPAFSNSGTCLLSLPLQAFLLPTLPHPVWCPWTRKLLSVTKHLVNPTQPSNKWLLNSSCQSAVPSQAAGFKLWPGCTWAGFGILQQKHKCLLLRTGVSFAPCVCENLSLQPAAMKHHGWKLKLQICSVHITSITLEKNICWTSFKPIRADNLNAVCQTTAGETAALQSLLQNGMQNFKLSLTLQTLVRSNCQES